MDKNKLASDILGVARDLMAANTTALRKSEDAADDGAPPAEEVERFNQKVVGIKPAILKPLGHIKNKKVNKFTDKISLQMTVEDLIDALLAVIAASGK